MPPKDTIPMERILWVIQNTGIEYETVKQVLESYDMYQTLLILNYLKGGNGNE